MSRPSPDYPAWVLKYKTKGTYINFVKPDKYYLYAAHSERIKGTDKVRRVSDGYIGRITEKDGLILSKKNRPPEDLNLYLLEFGLSHVVLSVSAHIRTGLNRSYKNNGDWIYVMSVLAYVHYGIYSDELLACSYLSVVFPDIEEPKRKTQSVLAGIERGTRMIADVMQRTFGDDLNEVKAYASSVGVIRKGSSFELSHIAPHASELFKKYQIEMEINHNAKD